MRITNPKTISKWNKIILEQQNSEQTITDFCKQIKVSTSCFHKWKSRLTNNKPVQETNVILADITENVVSLRDKLCKADSISEGQSKHLCEITFPNKVAIKVDGNISKGKPRNVA